MEDSFSLSTDPSAPKASVHQSWRCNEKVQPLLKWVAEEESRASLRQRLALFNRRSITGSSAVNFLASGQSPDGPGGDKEELDGFI